MKVTLISYTQQAAELLIFTKSTRLEMSPTLFEDICKWPEEKKLSELKYMANTIPSSWEFVDYTFLVTGVSRAFTHQVVRTRTASFAQQSMRVTNMNDFDFVYPEKIIQDGGDGLWFKDIGDSLIKGKDKDQNLELSVYGAKYIGQNAMNVVESVLDTIKRGYKALIDIGVQPEDARSILPTNIATNIVCKYNLRTFADLAKSRSGGRTQKEYQNVVNAMVDAVLAVHPWAQEFIFKQDRNYFDEIEAFALREFPDLKKRGELLKIVDKMRKGD